MSNKIGDSDIFTGNINIHIIPGRGITIIGENSSVTINDEKDIEIANAAIQKHNEGQDEMYVKLPCPLGTPVFRIYNTRGCENCTKNETACDGLECPPPKFYEKKFRYEHLAVLQDIKLTREEARAAIGNGGND